MSKPKTQKELNFRDMFRNQLFIILSGALAFIAAFAWNDTFQATLDRVIKKDDSIQSYYYYSIIVTAVIIVAIYILNRVLGVNKTSGDDFSFTRRKPTVMRLR